MKNLLYMFLSRLFLSGCSTYNSLSVRRLCRTKAQARAVFESNNIPYAKGLMFINPMKAFSFVKQYGFPVVVKPNLGGFSRGAYFPIENNMQLLKAVIGVKKWWHSSIVEKYLRGKNYRIVITKKGIMSIIRRYPPAIIGDGVNDISTLIDIENETKKAMKLTPVMHLIPKNYAIKKYLKQQQLSMHSVIKDKQKVYLHYRVALKFGSIVEIVDKQILSTNNRILLQKIIDYFDANILGIDVICKQFLDVDFDKQKAIFLELNSRPFLKMHHYPRYGKKEDLSSFYKYLEQIQVDDKNTF